MNNIINFLIISSILMNSNILHASTYDGDTLEIFSKIIPRFVLMSSKKDNIKDEISICILHDIVDDSLAKSLINKINNNYPNGIKNYRIKLIKTDYSTINTCANSQLSFIFNSNEKNIQKSMEFSNNHSILTMSYDPILLKDGIGISLFLGRNIVPYINVKAVRDNGIELNNVLLRISKIYKEDNY